MSQHLTEEEQIASMKQWWDHNGKSALIAVAIGVSGYFGWGAYQDQQRANAEAAGAEYQQLVAAVSADQGLSDEQKATANHLLTVLQEEHGSSLYAAQGALLVAKLAVMDNKLSAAAEHLQWVLDGSSDTPIKLLAAARLARVKLAQEQYDDVMSIAADKDSGVFKSTYAEIRADAQLAQGNTSAARAEYQLALENLLPEEASRGGLLQMKLDDLQTVFTISTEDVTDEVSE